MRRPVNAPYTVTNTFGVPDANAKFGRHSGTDYAVPTGTPVFAPVSGNLQNIVSITGGNMVVIFDGKYWHRLMHNSSFSRQNGRVEEGQQVAPSGNTGLSTGPHSHWDINTEGVYPTTFNSFIDPEKWLKEGGEMYEGKTAEQWAVDARNATNIAEVRAGYVAQLCNAAGVDPNQPLEQPQVSQAVANIDAKNKQIEALSQSAKFVPLGKEVFVKEG